MLYAHWEKRESYGRTVKITYYRYAVMFQGQALYVIPLYIDKSTHQIIADRPMIYTPENLGKITVKTRQKDGVVKRMELWLGNKKGQTLLQLRIHAENLRNGRFFPFNIVQQDECVAFEQFINALAQRVDAENPGVDDLIKAYDNDTLGTAGAVVSVLGMLLSVFGPAGIILSLIGLVLSVVSKLKGATGKKAMIVLIISIISIVWSAVFLFLFLKS